MTHPTTVLSPRIRRLLADVNDAAVQELHADMERSRGPIVEPLDGDGENVLVTFVWIGAAQAVTLATGVTPESEPARTRTMHRVPGSDVWWFSATLARDVCTTYRFVPDDAMLDIEDVVAVFANERDRFLAILGENAERSRRDPFNPDRIFPPGAWFTGLTELPDERWDSVLTLPDSPRAEFLAERDVPRGSVHEHTFASDALTNNRKVWVYTPPGYDPAHEPYPVVVLLDGSSWWLICPAATILDNLIADRLIPQVLSVWVDNPVPTARNIELACNDAFNTMLSDELLPWLRSIYRITDDPVKIAIGGASLGGLASSYAALRRPDVFGNVLSLSGSYWWGYAPLGTQTVPTGRGGHPEPEWLAQQYAAAPKLPVRFYIEVGRLEDKPIPVWAPGITHVAGNRHFRDVLVAKGNDVTYREPAGTHDFATWRRTLADGLLVLFGPSARGG